MFYERGGLAVRLAAYSVSANLFGIQDPGIDVFNAKRLSADFGGSYEIEKHLRIYFNVTNLLNTPHRFHEGSSDRVIQREYYGVTYQAGVRFDY